MKVKSTHIEFVSVAVAAMLDPALSLKAKGLLAMVIAWPPEEHLTVIAVQAASTDGRNAINAAWEELTAAGYLTEEPDGYRVAQNVQFPTVKNARNLHIHPGTPPPAPQSVIPAGRYELTTRKRTKRAVPSDEVARNVQKAPEHPMHETCSSAGENCTKPAPVENVATHPEPMVYITTPVEIEIQHPPQDDDSALLDGLTDEERDRTTIFARSWVGKLPRMAPILAKEAAEGIDIVHYFQAIMSWSSKLSPRIKKNQRTCDGWVNTIRDAIKRDRERGQLRMIGTPQQQADTNAGLMEFLNLGR